MLPITKQERMVLLFFAGVLFCGSLIGLAGKKGGDIRRILNFMESPELSRKLDLNKATLEELDALPYVGKVTAQRILDYRKAHAGFKNTDELKNIVSAGAWNRLANLVKVERRR